MKKVVKFKPIGVTFETVDILAREQETDALALYMAYSAISHWQETYRPRATTKFMMKRLGWSEYKLRKAKRVLVDKGLIENVKVTDGKGKYHGWYVEINHLVDSLPPVDSPQGGKSTGVDFQHPSTLNTNEVQSTPMKYSAKETFAKNEVNEIISIFHDTINPTINFGNKTSRKACDEMIKRFGFEEVVRITKAVCSIQGQPYAPTATTPYQMLDKLANFKIYFDKKKEESQSGVTFG